MFRFSWSSNLTFQAQVSWEHVNKRLVSLRPRSEVDQTRASVQHKEHGDPIHVEHAVVDGGSRLLRRRVAHLWCLWTRRLESRKASRDHGLHGQRGSGRLAGQGR